METPMNNDNHSNYRSMLVRLSTEAAEGLEDLQYAEKKRLRRRVTKRELLEQAVRTLIAQSARE
jgi:hypothetical protein